MSGQKLATYQLNVTQNVNPPTMYASQTGTNYYFGTKLIKNAGGYIGADRLGSIGHFYPYGQEKPSATQNGTEKFTGYFRDAETGLDYAVNRYHNPGTGHFLTPDLSYRSVRMADPQSWNRYAYVGNDPINHVDPSGLCDVVVGGITETSTDNSDSDYANSIGAMQAYPYAGTDYGTGVGSVMIGAITSGTWQALTVAEAINAAASDSSGPINLFIFSGGAQAFADALSDGYLSSDTLGRIQSITYASPGIVGTPATVNGIIPTVILGSGAVDAAATAGTVLPADWNIIRTSCGHDAGCEYAAANAAAHSGNPCNSPASFSAPGISTQQAINASLASLSSMFATMGAYDPFGYLGGYGVSMVSSTINFPSLDPVGCVTTPGLYGGPPDTICQ